MALEPESLEAILLLAGLNQAKGEYAVAIQLANRAVELDPKVFNGHSILGYCYLAKQQPTDAALSLAKAIAIQPEISILHHLFARALQQLDRESEAVKSFQTAIRLAPEVAESHIALGQLQLKMGDRADAVATFRKAHSLEPNSARGLAQLAKALTEEGEHNEAEVALRSAIAKGPNAAYVHAMLGELLMNDGRFEEAAGFLSRAIEIQPATGRPYLHLVQCRKMLRSDLHLVQRMEEILGTNAPGQETRRYLNYALGKAQDDLGDFNAAMRHFDEANRIMLQLARPKFKRETHEAQFEFAIRNFSREFIQERALVGSDSDMPVFVVGMIRSGTTLVEQILSSHPDVAAGGEMKFWLDNTRMVVDKAQSSIDTFMVPAVARRYLDQVQKIDPGKRRVVDKMPLNFMFLGLIHVAFPKARIIHCQRNPLDNCLSIYMTPFSTPVNYAHSRENIVYWYEEYLRLMAHWRRVLPPDQFMEVDYEDLVLNRERSTKKLVDFLGLDWTDDCLYPESNQRIVRTPSMWQVRQPVYGTSIGRWKNYEPWLGEFRKYLPGT